MVRCFTINIVIQYEYIKYNVIHKRGRIKMIYSRKELIYENEMGLPVEIAGEGQIVYIQYINGYRTKISITDILD